MLLKALVKDLPEMISASFNGTTVETTTSLTADGSLILYTWNDENGKKLLAFDFIMAQVLEQMYPESN
jgi:threonyl-tRNA synthetase